MNKDNQSPLSEGKETVEQAAYKTTQLYCTKDPVYFDDTVAGKLLTAK